MKKFELTNISKNINDGTGNMITLHRIRALRDIGTDVAEGDLGGWAEHEENLSHFGDSWIYPDALAYGRARVCDNATVLSESSVYDFAVIQNNVKIMENSEVHGHAKIYGDIVVSNASDIYGDSHIRGKGTIQISEIFHHAKIELSDDATIYMTKVLDDALISGNAHIFKSTIRGIASISENVYIDHSDVSGKPSIYGNSKILHSTINGNTQIKDNAYIKESYISGDTMIFGNVKIDNCRVYDEARIGENVSLSNNIYVCGKTKMIGDINLDGDKEGYRIKCFRIIKEEEKIPHIDKLIYGPAVSENFDFNAYIRSQRGSDGELSEHSMLFELLSQDSSTGGEVRISQEFSIDNDKFKQRLVLDILTDTFKNDKYSFTEINPETYDKEKDKLTDYFVFDGDIAKRLEENGIDLSENDITKAVVDKIVRENSIDSLISDAKEEISGEKKEKTPKKKNISLEI